MSSLKVIALVSGGKDSFFSILHCLAAGHTVVALANLYPPVHSSDLAVHEAAEDLNSFMYQTVGHEVIPLYEAATGIPLFRQEIIGKAVNSERDYSVVPAPGLNLDETESLIPLLRKIQVAHPDANAISTGAILSTYQRTRVESVALRLGLTPLSFLWQYPVLPPYSQSALLNDMRAVGQDARIIKVASGGLDETFLWQNVADSRTISRLGKAMARFCENGDGAVLGEGGEFETLAVDGPAILWKKKIEMESDRVILGEGGEAIWKGKSARLVEKAPTTTGLEMLRIPHLWDDEFKKILDTLKEAVIPFVLERSLIDEGLEQHTIPAEVGTSNFTNLHYKGNWSVTLSSQTCPVNTFTPLDPPAQLESILRSVVGTLATYDLDTSNVLHTTLILRSMSSFAAVNAIYSPFFTAPNPPSRVTIACGNRLPSGIDVMLSLVAANKYSTSKTDHEHSQQAINDPLTSTNKHVDPTPQTTAGMKKAERKGLHVQSRSYWAPANIGPYSQAVSTPLTNKQEEEGAPSAQVVFVAGQIPLVPASMSMFTDDGFAGQTLLALQHLFRIGRAVNANRWVAGIAFIPTSQDPPTSQRVRTAQAAWHAIHAASLPNNDNDNNDNEEEEEQQQQQQTPAEIDPWHLHNNPFRSALPFTDTTTRPDLPNPKILTNNPSDIPPVFVVQVAQLPRHAPIEWSALGLQAASITSSLVSRSTPRVYHTDVVGTQARFVVAEVAADGGWEWALAGVLAWDHCTLYAGPGLGVEGWAGLEGVAVVPCEGVWGFGGVRVAGVVVGRCWVGGV